MSTWKLSSDRFKSRPSMTPGPGEGRRGERRRRAARCTGGRACGAAHVLPCTLCCCRADALGTAGQAASALPAASAGALERAPRGGAPLKGPLLHPPPRPTDLAPQASTTPRTSTGGRQTPRAALSGMAGSSPRTCPRVSGPAVERDAQGGWGARHGRRVWRSRLRRADVRRAGKRRMAARLTTQPPRPVRNARPPCKAWAPAARRRRASPRPRGRASRSRPARTASTPGRPSASPSSRAS
jgi:hypothetical protein